MGTLVGIAVCVGNKRAVASAPSEVEPTGIMTFADPAMQALCAKTWGDGTNITYEQAREVTEIPKNWAKNNKTITSFNEIKYFKNCTSIGSSAFEGCSSMALTSLDLPLCTTIGGYAFNGCSSMAPTSLDLPLCKRIGWYAFRGCSSMALTSLKLPLCTSIGWSAFRGCSSIESIELASTMTTIADRAFQSCTVLTRISITADTPPTLGGTLVFDGCPALTGIYVPDDSVEAYKTATNWSAYANKILPLSQYKG